MSKGEGRARPDRVRTRTRNEKKFQKPLDKATKAWYNKYEKRKENLTNQKGTSP